MITAMMSLTGMRPTMQACLILRLLALVVLVLTPARVSAEPLVLDPARERIVVAPYAGMRVRDDIVFPQTRPVLGTPHYIGTPLPELVALADRGEFAPVTTRHPGVGLALAMLEFRIPVANPLPEPQTRILSFNRTWEDFYQVYLVIDGEPLPEAPIFEYDIYRDYGPRDDVVVHTPFTMPANATGAFYLSVLNINGAAPMTIETVDGYAAKRRGQDIQFFAFVGLSLGLVAITMSLMITLERNRALLYSGAVLCSLLFVISAETYIDFFIPGFIWALTETGFYSHLPTLSVVFALLFQRSWFHAAEGSTRIFGRVLLGAALLAAAASVSMFHFWLISVFHFVVVLAACALLVAVSGCIALYRRFTGSTAFAIGSLAYAGGLMIKMASYQFSWLLSSREGTMLMLYAVAIEAVALSAAMFAQVRALRTEKEAALREQLRTAEEKLALSEAMSHAAHDLQQPLSSLRMALAESHGDTRQANELRQAVEYLAMIVKNQMADALHHQPDPQLDVDSAPPEEVDRINEVFDVSVVLNGVRGMFANEAAAKGLDLRCVPSTARADANAFAVMRIVSNVVANAVRNTPRGKVLIGCRPRGTMLSLEVLDTGNGMSAQEIADLKAPRTRSGDYEGDGLGLSIINQLSRDHGLPCTITSEPGRGTHFRLLLPRAS